MNTKSLSINLLCKIRPYQDGDKESIFEMLSFLPSLYPGAFEWLDARLDDVLQGEAFCTLAADEIGPIGLTIETPKGSERVKLSTVYVRLGFRGSGVGTALLARCHRRWVLSGIASAYTTSDIRRAELLEPLLRKMGFIFMAIREHRYGFNRHEAIFEWTKPSRSSASTACMHRQGPPVYRSGREVLYQQGTLGESHGFFCNPQQI